MPLAVKPLALETATQLTEVCRWHRLGALYQASLAHVVNGTAGSFEINDIQWSTTLRDTHSMSSSRTLQLKDGVRILKFRSHAYADAVSDATPAELITQQNRPENPTGFWLDSYPYLTRLRAIHKSAGHVSIQSASIFKEKPGPEVMVVESSERVSIDEAEGLIRDVGGFLLAQLPTEIDCTTDIHDGMNPAY